VKGRKQALLTTTVHDRSFSMPMNSIATQIDKVIALRSESAKRIQPIAAKLSESNDCLEGVVRFVAEHGDRFDGGTKAVLTAFSTEAKTLQGRVREHEATLTRLLVRFGRPTLNIGVAGTAKQGKSTLLQSLSGLSDKVIPSGSGDHCTGAACVITNAEGPVRARITFHTERSFLHEVVQPFRDGLGLTFDLGSLDAFKRAVLPDKKSPGEPGYLDQACLGRLREMQVAVEDFRGNLGKPETEIGENEIRNYVAQEDSSGKRIHAWQAVREANVLCPFPQKDLGKITLLDTPGLGNFIYGADRRLMETIAERFDVVLLVRRPDPLSEAVLESDVKFFALVGDAIPDLKPADWCFLVLNDVGNNRQRFDGFLKNLLELANARTKEVFKLSCKDAGETQNMFQKLVESLARDIQGMDGHYAKCRLAPISELGADIHSFAVRAAKVLPAEIRALDSNLFNTLFGKVWEGMSHALNCLLAEYREQRGKPDPGFSAELKRVCENLEQGPGLPDKEQVIRESAADGLGAWHENRMHLLRNQMCSAFLASDASLNARFDELRSKVRNILATETGGQLSSLIPESDARTWWVEMEKKWADFHDSEAIQRDIRIFSEAGLKIRGFMLPRIRGCMDVLDRDSPEAAPFMLPAGAKAEESIARLTAAWQAASYRVGGEMHQFEEEASDALFAELETFVDAILRSGGPKRMEKRWASFYQEYRGEVWPDKFSELERTMRLRNEWKQCTHKLTAAGIELQSISTTNTPA
jgi:hypothetical protein